MPLGTETTLPPSPAQVTTCGQSEPWLLLLLLSLAERWLVIRQQETEIHLGDPQVGTEHTH